MTEEREKPKMRAKRAPVVGERKDSETARDAFYGETLIALRALTDQPPVLLNVPVWGYPGHGKTSSILTAIHYGKAQLHGISLATVTDPSDLALLHARYPELKASDLRLAAEVTRAHLNELAGRFFRDNQWPDATEAPAQLLLELQAVSGSLGFVLLPDLKGGSYEEVDDIARAALATPHALVMLVEPEEFTDDTHHRTADYRKEILRRLQKSARDGIPTCVMITMSDRQGEESAERIDRTEKELTQLLSGQNEAFKSISSLHRVSVIGDVSGDFSEAPPAANLRKPNALLHAWIWTLRQALEAPREEARAKAPKLDLRAQSGIPRLDAPSVPTLRLVASIEGSPGALLASFNDREAAAESYLFLASNGKFIEASVDYAAGTCTVVREVAHIDPMPENCDAFVVANHIFVGPATTNTLYHGARSGPLLKTSLPSVLQAWRAIGPRRVIGIAADGSIHSLYLRDRVWQDQDHLPGFFAPSPYAICGYVATEKLALALTGTESLGVDVTEQGKFGAIRKPNVSARFDGSWTLTNALGFFAARNSDNTIVAGRERQHTLGQLHPEWNPEFALCDGHPFVGWISSDNRLRAARVDTQKAIVTSEESAPMVEIAPTGVQWSGDGDYLVLTDANNGTFVFARSGF